jgi:hypothetical protein
MAVSKAGKRVVMSAATKADWKAVAMVEM